MAETREVTEGEFIESPGEGNTDLDQALKFDEFRASQEAQDSSLIVNVYLQPTNADGTASARGQLEHMFSCTVDQYTREQIINKVRDEFMNVGDVHWLIRIQIRKPGKRGLLLNQLCSVRKGTNLGGSPTGEKHGDVQGILASVNKMLQDSQARTEALLTRVIDKPALPVVDPIKIFLEGQRQSAEMFKELATAMRGTPAPGTPGAPGGLEDVLKQMMVFKQIREFMGDGIAGTAGAAASGSEMAEILKAVTPIAGPFMGVLVEYLKSKSAAPKALPALTGPAQPAQPTQPTAQSSAETSPQKTEAPKPDMIKEDKMLFAMRDQLGQLADVIAANPDPAAVGEQILTALPEEYDDPLFTVLNAPTWFERLAAVQPKLTPHKEWMTRLRDYILASFTSDDAANDAHE